MAAIDRLAWAMDRSGRLKNFGDDINPWLFKQISGRKPGYVQPEECYGAYIMAGSILEYAKQGTMVWGTGIYNSKFRVDPRAQYFACRGPLSREIILKCGGKCPDIYGDPVMTLPLFYDKPQEQKYDLGIVPHYIDQQRFNVNWPDNIKMIDITNMDSFIDDVRSCKKILSSSLHGIITADAYGIPAKWCKFSNAVAGDGIKFHDHFLSVGVEPYEPLDLRTHFKVCEVMDMIEPYDLKFDVNRLMDACPIVKDLKEYPFVEEVTFDL